MKKDKSVRRFDLKYLEKHVNHDSSGIYLHKIQDHLAVHPYHLNDMSSSVRELLNKKIGKYCTRFDGILCGYNNLKLLSESGGICDDSYFIHLNIQADFFTFKPTGEKLLHGVVNKKSNDHIGCLVHKIFNISLPKPKQPKIWIGDSLTVNSEVELKITCTNFDGKLPYMRGEIISVLKKAEENQDPGVEESSTVQKNPLSHIERKKKVKKASENTSEDTFKHEENTTSLVIDTELDLQKKKRKHVGELEITLKKKIKI